MRIRFLAPLSKQRAERFHQHRTGVQKHRPMGGGEPHDRVLAQGSQPDPNLAPVANAAYPFHESAFPQPVGEAYGAVMPDQEVPGDFSHGGTMGAGQGPDGQQELMLLRLQSLVPGRLLAEMEEATDLKAEIGESSIIRVSEVAGARRR